MKPKYSRNLSIFGAIVFTANAAYGTAITQTANDVFNATPQSSFIEATRWSNTTVPTVGNTYSTNGWTFRTPATNTTAYTFAGDSLTLSPRSSASFALSTAPTTMICKGTSSQTLTFTSLILEGGIVGQGNAATTTLAGNISVTAPSGFSISDGNDGRAIIVAAPIIGSSRLYVGSNNNYTTGVYTPTAYTNTFTVSGNNSSFSGGWSLGGTYSPTFFGGATTYNCTFNAASTTFKVGHANALGTGPLELNTGTLNLNGFSPTGLAGVTVPDAGSATIRTAGSTVTATAVTLGTTTGATLKIDNAGLANPVTAPLASTTLNVNGPSTLSVLGTGLATGTFPLISHTGAIGGASGFAGITLTLPPGVSGVPLDNVGSLDVNITAIEFIKWTGAINGNWNINSADTNWKTTVGLADTTYQENAAGASSVIFNESEVAASPVAIAVAATVSPNAFSINNPTKDYTFSGSSISGTGAFVKDGAGTVTFSNALTCTGGTTVNLGKVVLSGASPSSTTAPVATTIASGATLENSFATASLGQGPISCTGAGTLRKSGVGNLVFNGGNSTIALGAGGLIDIQAGRLTFGNYDAQGCSATANQGDLNIAASAIFDAYSANVAADKLTGGGTYQAGYFGPRSLTVGVNGGSSTFSGTIKGNGVDGNSQTQLVKKGTGTITLTGTVNARGAYGENSMEVRGGTTVSPSTLVFSPTDLLSTTGYTSGGISMSPGNNDVSVLTQTAGTLVGSVISVGEYGKGTYNFSGGTVNAGRIEFAWNGGGNNGASEMNISGSARINVNSNGQILMGQYWGRQVTINQTGGEVIQFSDAGVTRGGTGKMNFNGGNQNLTWNLSGGTLSLAGMGWAASGGGFGGGNGILNLNGGILQITSAAFAAPTGTANGMPVVSAKVLGDDVTPNSGAIIDNYGLAVTFAAPILHGPVGTFDGGLKLATSVPGGSLTLSGLNTYTGNTTVATGNTLVLADDAGMTFVLDGTANNKITGAGAVTINGDFTIDTFYANITNGNTWTLVNVSTLAETFGSTFTINGFTEAGITGVHTMTDGSSNVWTFTESTGVLSVSVPGSDAYVSWINGFSVSDPAAGADPDKDGMANLLEFVLNGNPSTSDTSILPALNVTSTAFEFTFQRRDDSLSPQTTQTFQYGTNLTGWTDIVIPAASGSVGLATVTVSAGVPSNSVTDTVMISIPKTEAGATGKLFGRLKVTKP